MLIGLVAIETTYLPRRVCAFYTYLLGDQVALGGSLCCAQLRRFSGGSGTWCGLTHHFDFLISVQHALVGGLPHPA
jgi:hypothetical protein